MFGGTASATRAATTSNMQRLLRDGARQRRRQRRLPSSREASTRDHREHAELAEGHAHASASAASITQADLWLQEPDAGARRSRFGIVTGDPADGDVHAANFPGASTAQLNNARGTSTRVLTGRVSQHHRQRAAERGHQPVPVPRATASQRGRMRQCGLLRRRTTGACAPNLTVNAGLRYELQQPFYARNNSYSTATLADVCGVSGIGGDGSATCSSRAR